VQLLDSGEGEFLRGIHEKLKPTKLPTCLQFKRRTYTGFVFTEEISRFIGGR
jgi:hypothetical protein